ncbi:MAG: hypothetical protein Q7S02_04560 [bacterium]|nr:hypothetical protein [bacterium]
MATLEELDKKIDTVTNAMVETQEMIGHVVKHMATKEDLQEVRDQMITRDQFDEALTKEDAMIVILKRFDEERVATTAWIQRVENEVLMLKRHLHLA